MLETPGGYDCSVGPIAVGGAGRKRGGSLYRFSMVIHSQATQERQLHIDMSAPGTSNSAPPPACHKRRVSLDNHHEKNLSTEQLASETHPWIPGTHGVETWSAGFKCPSGQGPGAALPVSLSHAGFPQAARLRTPADFNRVLRRGVRSTDSCFRVYACPNDIAVARLGITVSRKAAPAAVARNRIKRLVRESFRISRETLPTMDIVVQAFTPAAAMDNTGLRASLKWHWQELITRCAAS